MRYTSSTYNKLNNTWSLGDRRLHHRVWSFEKGRNQSFEQREQFFVSYAVRGPVISSNGLRADMPVINPISGPVTEPSPLNTRWQYVPHGNCQWLGVY